MQIDDPAQRPQVGHGPLPAHRAPPGRDDGAAALHGADGIGLHIQEGLHTQRVHQRLQEGALPLLNDQIGI